MAGKCVKCGSVLEHHAKRNDWLGLTCGFFLSAIAASWYGMIDDDWTYFYGGLLGFVLAAWASVKARSVKPEDFNEEKDLCVQCVKKKRDSIDEEKAQRLSKRVSEIVASLPDARREEIVMRLSKYYHSPKEMAREVETLQSAVNYEIAGRYEDSAKAYENLDLWSQAGIVRKMATGQTTKQKEKRV